MTTFSTKTFALTAVIALGTLMSTSAHAGVLRTADGAPVMTKEGANVFVAGGEVPCAEEARARAAKLADEAKEARERTVYFDFNKSTLNKASKRQLRLLALKLRAQKDKAITVVGFSDRMGAAAYNERLALKRAKAVRDFLVAKGVKARALEVRSLGKSAPKANCPADLVRAEMIACLREDRRVEIEIK